MANKWSELEHKADALPPAKRAELQNRIEAAIDELDTEQALTAVREAAARIEALEQEKIEATAELAKAAAAKRFRSIRANLHDPLRGIRVNRFPAGRAAARLESHNSGSSPVERGVCLAAGGA